MAFDRWSAVPLAVALAAAALIAWRLRGLCFEAALEGPLFARELRARLERGELESAVALARADALRGAWAARLAARALEVRDDPEELHFVLEDAEAEYRLLAQRDLLAIRAIGRLALPLALAIAIAAIGQGFGASSEQGTASAAAAGHWIARGVLAVTLGLTTAIACQLSVGVLAKQARLRLDEVRLARDSLSVLPRM